MSGTRRAKMELHEAQAGYVKMASSRPAVHPGLDVERFLIPPIRMDRMKLPRGRGSSCLEKSNMNFAGYFFSFMVQERKSMSRQDIGKR